MKAALTALAALLVVLLPPAARAESVERVLTLMSEQRYAEARATLDPLLGDDPTNPHAQLLHGVLRAHEGRAAEAVEILENLRRAAPDIPEIYNNLAVLYGAEGHLDEARALLLEAVERWPEFAMAHENLGVIYTELARRAYQLARELEPDVESLPGIAIDTVAAGPGPATAAAAATAAAPAGASCVTVGGIRDRADADEAGRWLRERGAEAVEIRAGPTSIALHRLYLPPLASRAAAAAKLREIRDRGVRDVAILGTGRFANGISFGVFRDAANMRRRAAALRELGYTPQSTVETREVEGFTIGARIDGAPGGLQNDWTSVYPRYPIERAACN